MDRTSRRTRRLGVASGLVIVLGSAVGCASGERADLSRSSGSPSTTSVEKVGADPIPGIDRTISLGGSMLLEPGRVEVGISRDEANAVLEGYGATRELMRAGEAPEVVAALYTNDDYGPVDVDSAREKGFANASIHKVFDRTPVVAAVWLGVPGELLAAATPSVGPINVEPRSGPAAPADVIFIFDAKTGEVRLFSIQPVEPLRSPD